MPIPAIRRVPPPPVPVPVPPQPVHWGRTYVSITGSNGEGEEIPLTGFSDPRWPGIIMQPGATGLDMAPVELHSDDSPNLDGGMFRSSRRVQREVMIPVHLHGIDRRSIKQLKNRLIRALNPENGYCVLKFVEGDGVPRYLYCYYKNGVEGSEGTDQAGFTWVKYGIHLVAFDPFFYSDDVVAAHWSFGEGYPFLSEGPDGEIDTEDDQPFYPLRLNVGLLNSETITVDNPGDVKAWPRWEITGPVKSFQFTSPDGKSFGISAQEGGDDVVAGGRTLIVDTRPGFKTLRDDQGVNYWPLLDPAPQLWPLPPGRSVVNVSMTAGSGTASLKLTFRPRYESY